MISFWREDTGAGITHPGGFAAAGVRCGLKTEGSDLALIVSDGPANVAGVFTTNLVHASSVRYSREVVRRGRARAVLCNAGNANACNGERGDLDTIRLAELVGAHLNVAPQEVLVAATGVIGHPLPMEKLEAGIPRAVDALDREDETDMGVARAIMTTDLRPKLIGASCRSDQWDGEAMIGGVCKGSGMIAPNMATMLCFVTTDVQIEPELLQSALTSAVERTFNRVTVDSDTSTNDMVLVLANGMGSARIADEGPAYTDFREALERVCRYLAREIARDGEGATKLVEVVVKGARTDTEAARVGRTIAESPLVKTALFGCDPNWGRIMAAAGRSGVLFDPMRSELHLGEICVFRSGQGAAFDKDAAHDYLTNDEVRVTLNLHSGDEQAVLWTCDYSYDYVKINAEYHT